MGVGRWARGALRVAEARLTRGRHSSIACDRQLCWLTRRSYGTLRRVYSEIWSWHYSTSPEYLRRPPDEISPPGRARGRTGRTFAGISSPSKMRLRKLDLMLHTQTHQKPAGYQGKPMGRGVEMKL